jgi:hypothetical protein
MKIIGYIAYMTQQEFDALPREMPARVKQFDCWLGEGRFGELKLHRQDDHDPHADHDCFVGGPPVVLRSIVITDSKDDLVLTCQCCGFTEVFNDGEVAFQQGWDAPPHFTEYVCCNLCPGSFVVLGQTARHKAAHDKWALEGRPEEFEIPT